MRHLCGPTITLNRVFCDYKPDIWGNYNRQNLFRFDVTVAAVYQEVKYAHQRFPMIKRHKQNQWSYEINLPPFEIHRSIRELTKTIYTDLQRYLKGPHDPRKIVLFHRNPYETTLKALLGNYVGQKYDPNNPTHRLLRDVFGINIQQDPSSVTDTEVYLTDPVIKAIWTHTLKTTVSKVIVEANLNTNYR